MAAVVRVTGSGQITIPAELRRKHNIASGDRLMITEDDQGRIVVNQKLRTAAELVGIFPLLPGVETDGDFDDLIHETVEEGYARKYAAECGELTEE